MFAYQTSPAIYICSEANRCENVIAALNNTAVLPGSFRKDKHLEKYASEDGVAGSRSTRTDITDAFDDLAIGIKTEAEKTRKVGAGLRGRFKNLIIP